MLNPILKRPFEKCANEPNSKAQRPKPKGEPYPIEAVNDDGCGDNDDLNQLAGAAQTENGTRERGHQKGAKMTPRRAWILTYGTNDARAMLRGPTITDRREQVHSTKVSREYCIYAIFWKATQ